MVPRHGHGQFLEAAELVGQDIRGGASVEQDVLAGPDFGRGPAGYHVLLLEPLAGSTTESPHAVSAG